jgi:hypothetical protein
VAATLAMIAVVRPEVVANVAVVAILLDPTNTDKFNEAATPVPPGGPDSKPPTQPIDPPINNEIPPGGGIGEPPSPE